MKSLEDLLAELRGFKSRAHELDTEFTGRSMTPEAQTEWNEVNTSIEETDKLVNELQARSARLQELAVEPTNVEHERSIPQVARPGIARGNDIYDMTSIRSSAMDSSVAAGEFRDRALRSIEGATFAPTAGDADAVRSELEELVRDRPDVGRHMLTTGSPQYRSAFRKTVMGQPLNGDEIRAMSLTGASGGFATLPYQLDPTIIRTGALAINPFRAIARTVQIAGTNTWKGVSSGAVVASFDAEASEVSDDSPTYAQPSITCYPRSPTRRVPKTRQRSAHPSR